MRKTRIEILLIGLTVIALSAGVVGGMLAARIPTSTAPPGPASEQTWLGEQLALSPEQQEQMKQIWEAVRGQVHQSFDDAQRLGRKRDDALLGLLDDEQKAKFQQISKDFAAQYNEIELKRRQAFDDAVERTKKLLNEQQRIKYEQILKSRMGPGVPPPTRPGAMTRPVEISSS